MSFVGLGSHLPLITMYTFVMLMEERYVYNAGTSIAIKMEIFGLYRINSYSNSPHESYVPSILLSTYMSSLNLTIKIMF